jgi:hypothetical protein
MSKATEVVDDAAAAGHTFYFGPSKVIEEHLHELEKLKYFAEG